MTQRDHVRARETTDETLDRVLYSRFDLETLQLDLKIYDHKEETVSFFELALTNETLSEDMLKVFGSLEKLYDTCFAKKENYVIDGNGRLQISYNIQLKSDLMEKEVYLHMLSVQKN